MCQELQRCDRGMLWCASDGRSIAYSHVSPTGLDEFDGYQPGDCYKCPCGWRPVVPPHQKPSKTLQVATSHWRECQGTVPPRISKEAHQWVSKVSAHAPHIREAQRSNAFARFQAWRNSIPSKFRDGVCDFDPELVETKVFKYSYQTLICFLV